MLNMLFAPMKRMLRQLLGGTRFQGSYWSAEHVEHITTSGGTRIHMDHLGKVLAARRARYVYDPDIEYARLVPVGEAQSAPEPRQTFATTMRRLVGRDV